MTTESEQRELQRLRESLGDWALGDLRRALSGGAKVGAFILAAHYIDTLARLSQRKKSDGKAAWDEFIPTFLPDYYALQAEDLYRWFRGQLSHWYSLTDFRLVDTEAFRFRHWTVEDGDRVLHLETFIEDVEAAWATFIVEVDNEPEFRRRVLERTREAPLVSVVHSTLEGGRGPYDLPIPAATATHFGTALPASGSPGPGWQDAPPAQIKEPEE